MKIRTAFLDGAGVFVIAGAVLRATAASDKRDRVATVLIGNAIYIVEPASLGNVFGHVSSP
jgi:hypothetical protein